MIQLKNAIYIDVPKTASSYVCSALATMFSLNMYEDVHPTRHDRLQELPDLGNTLVFATIRNPYTYYPSAWEHFEKHAGIHETMKELVIGSKGAARSASIGTFTSKYVNYIDQSFFETQRTKDEVREWFEKTWFSDNPNLVMIGALSVKEELINLLDTRREMFPHVEDYDERLNILKERKTSIMHDNVGNFQQEVPNLDVCDLIAEKDSILIDHFGYTRDDLQTEYLEDMDA